MTMKILTERREKAERRQAAVLHKGRAALITMVLASVCWTSPASFAQTPSDQQGSKGTKRTLSNPLNDLLDDARRDIDKEDFQGAVVALQKFIAEKDDFAYAHFQ